MLSILIPTYNYVCVKLVTDLQQQAEGLECPYEILVADDASEDAFKRENRKINGIPGCKYIELQENVGRSRIRNILGRLARYDFFLFLDCDGGIVNADFLARYKALLDKADVICGSILHPSKQPSPDVSLRYTYEKHAEHKFTAQKRMQHPYAMFRSFNFLISRSAFQACPFDETIRNYGYEDVMMGLALGRAKVSILHIDNPLMNEDIEKNAVFLHKTEESLRTLYVHRQKLGYCTGVLRLYGILQRMHLIFSILLLYRLLCRVIRRNLLGKRPSLALFAFYKIGYYCNLAKERK